MFKICAAVFGVLIAIPVLIGAATQGAVSAALGSASQPSPAALADIPGDYLDLYRTAASVCPGLDWAILAAIGKIETDHGRYDAPGVRNGENFAGAGGPMQFLQPTFNAVLGRHTIPPGGASPPSRYNPHDAVHAAAYYLCDNGARDAADISGALYAYNPSQSYVQRVLNQADRYRAAESARGQIILAAAMRWIGTPYS